MRPTSVVLLVVVALPACGGTERGGAAPSTNLRDGDRVRYEAGDVAPGKTRIVCRGEDGVSAAAVVPERAGSGVSGIADGPRSSASITVKMGVDGETVTAACDVD